MIQITKFQQSLRSITNPAAIVLKPQSYSTAAEYSGELVRHQPDVWTVYIQLSSTFIFTLQFLSVTLLLHVHVSVFLAFKFSFLKIRQVTKLKDVIVQGIKILWCPLVNI